MPQGYQQRQNPLTQTSLNAELEPRSGPYESSALGPLPLDLRHEDGPDLFGWEAAGANHNKSHEAPQATGGDAGDGGEQEVVDDLESQVPDLQVCAQYLYQLGSITHFFTRPIAGHCA